MKNFNFPLFLGCYAIGISIIILGILISSNLPVIPLVPSNLAVTTLNSESEFNDFLLEYEVAGFLSISTGDALNLIASGEFDTFSTKIGD